MKSGSEDFKSQAGLTLDRTWVGDHLDYSDMPSIPTDFFHIFDLYLLVSS